MYIYIYIYIYIYRGKLWLPWLLIHVILTYLVKVNVGGMEFIYISSYRAVFSLFLIRKTILKLIIQ